MNLITQCFEQHYSALAQALLNEDFSIEQIGLFLPLAAINISAVADNTSVFQTFSCLNARSPSAMLRKFDLRGLANKAGINSVKAALGLQIIAPLLSQAYVQHSAYQRLMLNAETYSNDKLLKQPAQSFTTVAA